MPEQSQGVPALLVGLWGVAFADEEREALYTSERFRACYGPFVAFLGFLLALSTASAVLFPQSSFYCLAFAMVSGGALAGRVWAHRLPDQQRARLLFGCALIAMVLACWAVALPLVWASPPAPSDSGIVATFAVSYLLVPVYLHHTALRPLDQRHLRQQH